MDMPMKFDFKRIQPLRSLILFGAGALCALALASSGLFARLGPAVQHVPPEAAALVNRRPILRADVIARTEAETAKTFGEATAAERAKVLAEMIREELFVQRGLELDVPGSDPETREALVEAVERRAFAEATANVPTDAQLERYYQDNRARYASEGVMTLHNLLLPSASPGAMAAARQAADALRAGTPLPAAVTAFGLQDVVPEHATLEQFYFSERVHLGDALFAVASKLNDGQVSEPIVAPDGVHILQMLRNVRPTPLPFDRVCGQVLNDYVAAAKQRLEDAEARMLRNKADILIADDLRAADTGLAAAGGGAWR
jgi:hypothetical protein